MGQVVNAPVRNPCHAGTDEGDRSVGRAERGVRSVHPAASGSQRDRVSVSQSFSFSFSLFFSFSFCPFRSLPRPRFILLPRLVAVLLPPSASSFPSVPPQYLRTVCLVPRTFPLSFGVSFFFFLSVSFYWQQPPTPSRFYTGKSIQPYVRLAGTSAVLVHGFRNLLQLDRINGAIVRRR